MILDTSAADLGLVEWYVPWLLEYGWWFESHPTKCFIPQNTALPPNRSLNNGKPNKSDSSFNGTMIPPTPPPPKP